MNPPAQMDAARIRYASPSHACSGSVHVLDSHARRTLSPHMRPSRLAADEHGTTTHFKGSRAATNAPRAARHRQIMRKKPSARRLRARWSYMSAKLRPAYNPTPYARQRARSSRAAPAHLGWPETAKRKARWLRTATTKRHNRARRAPPSLRCAPALIPWRASVRARRRCYRSAARRARTHDLVDRGAKIR
jgi:hypothetical protein